MNLTLFNTTFPACTNLGFSPPYPANISSAVYAAFVTKITINVLTCPFIILLNILVIFAVKTKGGLRTKSNIALVCLATTDLVVALVVQPLKIASFSLMLHDDETQNTVCIVSSVNKNVSPICVAASLLHSLLNKKRRYMIVLRDSVHQ